MSKGFDPADDLTAFSSGSAQNNMDLFQRLNAMLENNIDLASLAQADSARRSISDNGVSMSDLLNNPQQDDMMALLQQHQLNQALQQQLEQHRQQLRLNSSTNLVQPDALAKLLPSSSAPRGLGESPLSTGSSPASGLRMSTSNGNVFSGGIQTASHSTPSSAGRAIRGTPIRRDTGSPTLEQMLLLSCNQRNNTEPQGASAVDSEFSMLSTPGVTSSMETSLSELMQSLNLRSTGSTNASPTARWLSLQQQQQQQQALQAAKLQASLQAAFQQNNLLGSLGLEANGQSSSLQTSLQNIQDLASLQNLQVWQNIRNLQSLQNLAGNGALSTAALSALLQGCSSPTATVFNDRNDTWNTQIPPTPESSSLERAARMYRSAAALSEATYTWSGILPPRPYNKNPTYSCKVFLGGVPWDITEAALLNAFKQYGNIKVEWPGKDSVANPPKGYVYIIFEHEKQVKNLLQACTQDYSNGGSWYYKISSRRMRSKEVQVIPWMLSDSNFVRTPSNRLDPQKTVFVGALHGMLNAEGLAHIMNDLFGGVLYAGIDTDKHKYPIGSGRVTFSNNRSYMKAVAAAFIEIKTPKFSKKVQVDPYLEDSLCAVCGVHQGPYFCRDLTCFKYFCRSCWQWQHNNDLLKHHRPLMRHYKGAYLSNSGASANPGASGTNNNNEGSPTQSREEQLTEST